LTQLNSSWVINEKKPSPDARNFKGGHWDESNVLVHIRTDEVLGADGKRYLRVGELQSDWGQKGKKEGFLDAKQAARDRKALLDGLRAIGFRNAQPENLNLADLKGRNAPDETIALFRKVTNTPAVPNAPFVTDTKAWVALGIKQAIRQAIDAGVDGIVFGTGEQNANLYSLERQVNSIDYAKEGNGTYSLMIATKDGGGVCPISSRN
jgi:hypothetical protein